MSLRGNLGTINGLKARIRALPTTIAHNVAQRAAPALTELAREAFDSGRNVYGEARPGGVHGALTLERTGETKRTIQFTSAGTIVRCVLGTQYARYLIGKYGILPNGRLPVAWSKRLGEIVREPGVAP